MRDPDEQNPPRDRDLSAAEPSAASASLVRVMTWNIHGGVGIDGRRDLQRIVDIVHKHDPDVVALQEVGSRRQVAEAIEAFSILGTLGQHVIETRIITARDGHYGHALICRWPLTNIRYHDLSYRTREPRAAIEAVARTPFGPLHVVAAHLGLSFTERKHQAQLLTELVRSGSAPAVLMGDLNDWVWRGSVQKALNRIFPGHTHFKTFPSFWPVFALDRIYCSPTRMLRKQWTDPQASVASDHLPLFADLEMKFAAGTEESLFEDDGRG